MQLLFYPMLLLFINIHLLFPALMSVIERHIMNVSLTCPYKASAINLSTRSEMKSHTLLQCAQNRNLLQHTKLPWQ